MAERTEYEMAQGDIGEDKGREGERAGGMRKERDRG